MIGPKTAPMPPVPRRCTTNSAIRIDDRDRHDERLEGVRRHTEALDRAQHRDRRRDHAVAVQQRGAEQADRDQQRGAPAGPVFARTSATSARMPPSPPLSARITNSRYLIDDRDDQRPEDQRQDAEHVRRRDRDRVIAGRSTRAARTAGSCRCRRRRRRARRESGTATRERCGSTAAMVMRAFCGPSAVQRSNRTWMRN